MRNTFEPRFILRAVVGALIAGAALGLAGCQTPQIAPTPSPVAAPQAGPVDHATVERYAGRTADRVAEDLDRQVRAGQLPSPDCRRHIVVEHPDGGFHLACIAPAPAE